MFVDAFRLVQGLLRSNAIWLLFILGVGAQGVAMRMALHRARPLEPASADDCDLVVSQAVSEPAVRIAELPELLEPVDGVEVPKSPDLLPGAAREYRGGVHEGVDFRCVRGLPVRAAADAKVLTIEDEPNLPERQRDDLLRVCRVLGETPPEVLRSLHGRRITLNLGVHAGHLLTASYSHLASIRPDLKPGMAVRAGEVIGMTGASGTSHDYRPDGWGEVHFELRWDGQPLGLALGPSQAGKAYREALGEGR